VPRRACRETATEGGAIRAEAPTRCKGTCQREPRTGLDGGVIGAAAVPAGTSSSARGCRSRTAAKPPPKDGWSVVPARTSSHAQRPVDGSRETATEGGAIRAEALPLTRRPGICRREPRTGLDGGVIGAAAVPAGTSSQAQGPVEGSRETATEGRGVGGPSWDVEPCASVPVEDRRETATEGRVVGGPSWDVACASPLRGGIVFQPAT
jgi:hypothetical protein